LVLRNVDKVVISLGNQFFVVDSHLLDQIVDGIDHQFCEVEMLEIKVKLCETIILVNIENDVEIVGGVACSD